MATVQSYRPIMVVDVAGFSSRPGPVQSTVRAALYRILTGALESAGVTADDIADRGDGELVVLPAGASPAPLVASVPEALAALLTAYNETAPAAERIRMRMAVHAGHVHRDARGWAGPAVILPFRLVDSAPLRRVLGRCADPVTVCVSDEVYRGVVRDDALTPEAYQPVRVRLKELRAVGWVRVPGRRPPLPGARRSVGSVVGIVTGIVTGIVAGVVAVAVTATVVAWDRDATGGRSSGTASPSVAPEPASLPPLTFGAGPTTQLVAIHSGKCMVPGPDARVVQRVCPPPAERQWDVAFATNAGTADPIVRLVSRGAGGCVTAPRPGPAAGAVSVVIRQCATPPTLDQVWRFHITGRVKGWTYGRFMSQQREADHLTGACLDVNGGHTGDDAVLVTWQCNDAKNQMFRIVV